MQFQTINTFPTWFELNLKIHTACQLAHEIQHYQHTRQTMQHHNSSNLTRVFVNI